MLSFSEVKLDLYNSQTQMKEIPKVNLEADEAISVLPMHGWVNAPWAMTLLISKPGEIHKAIINQPTIILSFLLTLLLYLVYNNI